MNKDACFNPYLIAFDEYDLEVCDSIIKLGEKVCPGYHEEEYAKIEADIRFDFCQLVTDYIRLLKLKMRDTSNNSLELLKRYKELLKITNHEQS